MPEHGEHDKDRWFCGYWMPREEWDDVHDYAPPSVGQAEQAEEQEEG